MRYFINAVLFSLLIIGIGVSQNRAIAQQNIMINLAAVDGIAITPDNIFNYQIQASSAGTVQVKGTVRYKNSGLSLSYSFSQVLSPGLNMVYKDIVHPQWQFSSSALEELFFQYKTLPEGTFEYCVSVIPAKGAAENAGGAFESCIYHRADGVFLINLVDPSDNAKLKERNPMLSWIANYAFVNEVTYRLRVAEVKHGQNPVNAVMRNQPMYDEKNLIQNSIVYPIYAKPLEANKLYAWTVDAYYKGILLGGAETWRFTIPEDSPKVTYPVTRSYLDIKLENGTSAYYILGELKLKYVLDKLRSDQLNLELVDESGRSMKLTPGELSAVYGDNRYVINLHENSNLKHLGNYKLNITTKSGAGYTLAFKYLNPEFVR